MIGTIRWNLIVGAFAFLLTFLLSISNNIWQTTLLRSLYSFIALFILVFFCRWLLGTFAGLNQMQGSSMDTEDEIGKGTAVDASTPDQDDELHQMLRASLDPNSSPQPFEFSPLNPPKLSTKKHSDPEELAQALRRMSEE
ncbi:hypothetical protein [Paenibacillus cremeus]|uniref:Transmembrane protein n=1 Tax=Paenibacillus cremeus TaxID=2163881 RepID=A0A559KET2_9BACL|nr:hypothetical protein [Paenibacillus cremeus]TVY10634.1 hypothetical protein FPZ49_07825 [Paenibacillus cremeus]